MDVIKDILSALQSTLGKENKRILVGSNHIPIDVDKIQPIAEVQTDSFVGFVDGGNAEILKGANFSVQFIRVFGSVYNGRKKMEKFTKEFFVLIHAVVDEEVYYEITPFQTDETFTRVHARDQDLTSKNVSLSASMVGGVVRKIAEVRMAKELMNKMSSGILVLDGDLDVKNDYEVKDLEELERGCKQKDIHLVGLSKTTQLLTNSGDSAVAVLAQMGKGSWYYGGGRVNFVRLHERSTYVFRLDLSEPERLGQVASILAQYAVDPVFLGYPYGLVEADRFARVSNDEREYLKTLFLAQSGDLGRYLHAQDAHAVLDSIG